MKRLRDAARIPGATGVIDLDGFLQPLAKIGYDGLVRAEPFSTTLNMLDNETAMNVTIDSLKAAVAKAGL